MTDEIHQDVIDQQPSSSDNGLPQQAPPSSTDASLESLPISGTEWVESVPDQTPAGQPVPADSVGSKDNQPGPAFVEKETSLESVVEAILFASDEPLSAERIAGIAEISAIKPVRESVEALNSQYEQSGRAFRIEQIAGGYQMMTLPHYNPWLKKLLRNRADNKFSPAALETLAIISYKQPIIRADIEAIRGVASGEILRSLMYKGLVKIVGRAEVIGRPMLYGTTRKFLEVFGLNSIKDLPKVEELKNPQP